MEDDVKMHLKEWLIAQIDSEQYEGLRWENNDRTVFRIPWKHAAKKDYRQKEDAALFKAWAVYKDRLIEGSSKDNPTMWKTRLRCALNKSTDFKEMPELNQLDISEPYKVYRIEPCITDPARIIGSSRMESRVVAETEGSTTEPSYCRTPQRQLHYQCGLIEERKGEMNDALLMEHMYCGSGSQEGRPPSGPLLPSLLTPRLSISDFRMQLKLFYHGEAAIELTTSSPDGCFILQGLVPVGNEKIYGPCSAQQLSFPAPSCVPLKPGLVKALGHLLTHLERGVLLWVAPDGVFIKRFCQGRVYWSGPLAVHTERPNKLERERTCKLLDMPIFVNELQNHLHREGPPPQYKIELCFGEEFPDPNTPKTMKLITVEVVPMFAVELLQRMHLGQTNAGPHLSTVDTGEEEAR